MASVREQMRAQLSEQTKAAHSRKDGAGFKNYLDVTKTEKIPKFNPPKGETILDIIPYFAGKYDPNAPEGSSVFHLDINVHMGIGPTEERIVCLAQYKKPCPICELIKAKKDKQEDYKTKIKPLVAKRRCLYNVIVRENAEEEKKGVQLFEISHFFLQKHISALSKQPRTGGYIVYSDPDTGKSIGFNRTGVGADNTAYEAYQFIDRPAPISDEELDSARCLDELITILTYDEIYSILHAAKQETSPEGTETPEAEGPPERQVSVEKPKVTEKGDEPKCPVEGGIFGKSNDEFEECNDCDFYRACARKALGK